MSLAWLRALGQFTSSKTDADFREIVRTNKCTLHSDSYENFQLKIRLFTSMIYTLSGCLYLIELCLCPKCRTTLGLDSSRIY